LAQLRQLYISWIRPALEYAAPLITVAAANSSLEKLYKSQPQCLKRLMQLPPHAPDRATEWQFKTTPMKLRQERRTIALVERGMRLPQEHILKRSLMEQENDLATTGSRLKRPHLIIKAEKATHCILPELENRERMAIGTDTENPMLKLEHLAFRTVPITSSKEILTTYPTSEWTHIYTDGSLNIHNKTAGTGILIQQNGNNITENSTQEDPLWSITDLETKAITRALSYLDFLPSNPVTQGKDQRKNVVILSDSLASVIRLKNAAENPQCKHTLSNIFNKTVKRLTIGDKPGNYRITIQWILGHKGIEGNEKADQLAKNRIEPQPHLSIHYEAATTALKTATHRVWAQNMATDKTKAARTSKQNLPLHKWNKQGLHFLPKNHQSIILQLRINTFPTRRRLALLKKVASSKCECGHEETIQHMLKDCKRHTKVRKEIWGTNIPRLRDMLYGHLQQLSNTIHFLQMTKRLSE
jgi:ribonuclease HI